MAKNAKNEIAIKGRQTKLSKKSNEELIQIILRKDAIERNLNKQVINLKSEINSLGVRIKGFEKDMEGTEQSLETYKDKFATTCEQLDELNSELKQVRNAKEELYQKYDKLEDTANLYKGVAWITGIAFIAMIVATSIF